MCVVPTCMYHTAHVRGACGDQERALNPWTRVTDDCGPLCMCWEWNLGPLRKQQILKVWVTSPAILSSPAFQNRSQEGTASLEVSALEKYISLYELIPCMLQISVALRKSNGYRKRLFW